MISEKRIKERTAVALKVTIVKALGERRLPYKYIRCHCKFSPRAGENQWCFGCLWEVDMFGRTRGRCDNFSTCNLSRCKNLSFDIIQMVVQGRLTLSCLMSCFLVSAISPFPESTLNWHRWLTDSPCYCFHPSCFNSQVLILSRSL